MHGSTLSSTPLRRTLERRQTPSSTAASGVFAPHTLERAGAGAWPLNRGMLEKKGRQKACSRMPMRSSGDQRR